MKYPFKLLLTASIVTAISSLSIASEVVFPSTQIEEGKFNVSLYHTRLDQKLTIRTSGLEQITLPGNLTYFGNVSNDIEADARINQAALRVIFNPDEQLYLWFKLGYAAFELEYPSSTVKNELSGLVPGTVMGAGVRCQLHPDTNYTPSVTAEIGFNYSHFDMNRLKQGALSISRVNNTLDLFEAQAAVETGKRLGLFEVFGGMKVRRVYLTLTDMDSLAGVAGIKDSAALFAGCKYKVSKSGSIFVVFDAFGENGISSGFNAEF